MAPTVDAVNTRHAAALTVRVVGYLVFITKAFSKEGKSLAKLGRAPSWLCNCQWFGRMSFWKSGWKFRYSGTTFGDF